jgi:ABC-type polysaccharide/polyol phosphate export permease
LTEFSETSFAATSASPVHGYDAAAAKAWPARINQAAVDLYVGATKFWLWGELAKQDIRLRYRGSMIGPLWLTLSTAIWIGAMGFLYAKLFNSPPETYLPFLSVGLVMWQFLASLITEGCGTFTAVTGIIQQVPMPVSIHVYRLVLRNLLVLAHNMILIPIILLIFHIMPDWRCVWIIPGLLVMCVNGVWISILLGMLGARYRDVPPIVSSFVQVVFFVTPIFWPPGNLGRWAAIGQLNPLFAAIDVVRAPILGIPEAPYSWEVLFLMTAIGCAITFFVFARFRYRIPFWV